MLKTSEVSIIEQLSAKQYNELAEQFDQASTAAYQQGGATWAAFVLARNGEFFRKLANEAAHRQAAHRQA